MQWALSAALESIRAVVRLGYSSPSAERDGMLEAALSLVVASANERRLASGEGGTALVSQILDACGPRGLGPFLTTSGSDEDSMQMRLLSPPLRETLLGLPEALLNNHWRILSASDASLTVLVQLLAVGLSVPTDAPTFRRCLPATTLLHQRLFAQSAGAVAAAKLALQGVPRLGGGNGDANGTSVGASAAVLELASQVRCFVLSVRLDPSHAQLHDEATDCVYECVRATARGGKDAAVAHCAQSLVERCMASLSWLGRDVAAKLLGDFASSELTDEVSFKGALSRLASDLASLRSEAAHAERGAARFA